MSSRSDSTSSFSSTGGCTHTATRFPPLLTISSGSTASYSPFFFCLASCSKVMVRPLTQTSTDEPFDASDNLNVLAARLSAGTSNAWRK